MRLHRWIVVIVTVAGVLGLGARAHAQAPERLDKYSLEAWGGTWLADCAKKDAPKVVVSEASLMFSNGKANVVGTNFRAAASWFGNSPPDNYVTVLLADQPEDLQLLAIIYKDEKGEYLVLDGDPKLIAAIGKANAETKYRKCPAPGAEKAAAEKAATDKAAKDKAAVAAAADAAAKSTDAAGAPAAGEMQTASAMLLDPDFKKAYMKALGKYGKEPWIAEMGGPSSESVKKTVGGKEYTFSNVCKDHDCYENNLVVAYDGTKKAAYGKVFTGGKSAMFGNPPPELAKEIGEYWRLTYRANP